MVKKNNLAEFLLLSKSSETTSEAPFHPEKKFAGFYAYGHPANIPRLTPTFLAWFIGFFEGEGCFVGAPTRQQLTVTVTQKEKRILEIIQKNLGFGNLNSSQDQRTEEIYWRWSADSKKMFKL